MNLTVIGAGYAGLTTAVSFAHRGHRVRIIDVDTEKVERINLGIPPIYEYGLDRLLKKTLKTGMLAASTDTEGAVAESDITFICVGTPSRSDGHIDLSNIVEVSEAVGRCLKKARRRHIVAVKSTVLPGTTEEEVIPRIQRRSGLKAVSGFGVCVNPEFLREGRAVRDFLDPRGSGIVIGESDRASGDRLAELYRGFRGRILRTDLRTAEMIKYARNAYLAKDISFSNEVANICSTLKIDYLKVREGMEMDRRIGVGRFLSAGIGYGGSCFKKDLTALICKAEEEGGIDPKLLKATEQVNEQQPFVAVGLAEEALGTLRGKKITILGLAFKDGTDDIRESRALKLIEALLKAGADITAYDPKATGNAEKILGGRVRYAQAAEEAVEECDCCIVATEWPEFKNQKIYGKMKGSILIDGRRIVSPETIPRRVRYYGIGYPSAP